MLGASLERRIRRRAAREALEGRLRAAYDRIVDLEAQVAALSGGKDGELVGRLGLIAPELAAGIAAASAGDAPAVEQLVHSKRNLAAHEYGIPASRIANMSQAECNRAQRQRRGRCGPRKPAPESPDVPEVTVTALKSGDEQISLTGCVDRMTQDQIVEMPTLMTQEEMIRGPEVAQQEHVAHQMVDEVASATIGSLSPGPFFDTGNCERG